MMLFILICTRVESIISARLIIIEPKPIGIAVFTIIRRVVPALLGFGELFSSSAVIPSPPFLYLMKRKTNPNSEPTDIPVIAAPIAIGIIADCASISFAHFTPKT